MASIAMYCALFYFGLKKRPIFTIGPEKTINGSLVYTIHMELREGAKNQNIGSSRGAASYILTFEMILPGGPVQFGFSNSPAGRPLPIDKPASADRSGDQTRPPKAAESPGSTRQPPGSTISKVKMYEAAPREDRIF